jgi:hypothetical protein
MLLVAAVLLTWGMVLTTSSTALVHAGVAAPDPPVTARAEPRVPIMPHAARPQIAPTAPSTSAAPTPAPTAPTAPSTSAAPTPAPTAQRPQRAGPYPTHAPRAHPKPKSQAGYDPSGI